MTVDILKRLKDIFFDLCQNQNSELIEFSGGLNYVQLLIDFFPDVAPVKFVNTLKTISSQMIRNEFSNHINKFYWRPIFWMETSCIISSGGAPLEVLKQYIQNQKKYE